jgi:hypothetical protein
LPADVLAIIVRQLLPSPHAILNLPPTAAPREADRCWREHSSQIRIARNTLLSLRLVSKLLHSGLTKIDALSFHICLGLYPKYTARLTGCASFSALQRMRVQFSRREFSGFGQGHDEHWRVSPEGQALAHDIGLAVEKQRDFLMAAEAAVLGRAWCARGNNAAVHEVWGSVC